MGNCVALATIGALVPGVIELDDQARGEGARLAQVEVDAFGLDAPPVQLVVACPRLHFDQIGQAHLSEEQHTGGGSGLERGKEIALGGAEQVWDAGVGQTGRRRRRLRWKRGRCSSGCGCIRGR